MMQKMIMISKERYEKMLESYDKAIEELEALRGMLDEMQSAEVKENSLPVSAGQAKS